jgi:hypothetical protein
MATYLEAQKSLCRKLNIDYTTIAQNDLFSLEDIKDYLMTGVRQAWDFAYWRFSELSRLSSLGTTQYTAKYIDYPTNIAPASIWYLRIAGKKWDKKNFATFLKFLEDNPTSTDKIWAEHGRKIFFNASACSLNDSIELFGKKTAPALSADGDLMPFSPDTDNDEYSGNEAVILIAYAEALSSEKKKNPAQGEIERKKAFAVLANLSAQLDAGKATEQDKNRPMFDVPDFFAGNRSTSSTTGTFSQ